MNILCETCAYYDTDKDEQPCCCCDGENWEMESEKECLICQKQNAKNVSIAY